MDQADLARAKEVVRRFFARRSDGARVSIDDVMPRMQDASDRNQLRTQVIRLIADRTRVQQADGDSSSNGADHPQFSIAFPTIAGYEIIDWIGRGGMGLVYEAYQIATGRRVAIKVLLDSAVADAAARRRFEREVELAARLQHPDIVPVIDSGIHIGKHYLVMDYIDGRPLDQAVRDDRMSPRETLKLIARVARAVDYAHQRGVLHRDLKPTNILLDSGGAPRLLDFGLAKAIVSSETGPVAEPSLSEPAGFVGTLGYVAPEQAAGASLEVSVRSDVYSLGVVAYALLTGQLPISVRGPIHDVLRDIQLRAPVIPSSIEPRLDRDIDALLLKALEKSPTARFTTAAEFAEDIERYLRHEPVRARRVGLAGRLIRWVRRRPALAAAITTISAAVVVSALLLAQVVREQSHRAAAEAARGAAYAFVLENLKTAADPNRAARGDVLRGAGKTIALERIRATEAQLDSMRAAEGTFRAYVLQELGRGYMQCAGYDPAAECLRAAHAAFSSAGSGFMRERHSVEHDLALLEMARGNYAVARDRLAVLFRDMEQDVRAVAGPLFAQVCNDLAWATKELGEFEQARLRYRTTLELRNRLGDRLGLAETFNDLAQLERSAGVFDAAIAAFEQALRIRREVCGENHTATAATQAGLGSTLRQVEQMADAEPYLRAALQTRERILGAEHPDTIVSMNELGLWLLDTNQFSQAEHLLREALRLRLAVDGAMHRRVAVSLTNLGLVLSAQGRFDEARERIVEALSMYESRSEAHLPDAIHARLHLGNLERRAGRMEAAADAARIALAAAERRSTDSGALIGAARLLHGRALLGLGNLDDARAELLVALQLHMTIPNLPAWRLQLARLCLAHAQAVSGDPAAALATLSELQTPLSLRREITEALHALLAAAENRTEDELSQRVRSLAAERNP